jgi:hypothetical protein
MILFIFELSRIDIDRASVWEKRSFFSTGGGRCLSAADFT